MIALSGWVGGTLSSDAATEALGAMKAALNRGLPSPASIVGAGDNRGMIIAAHVAADDASAGNRVAGVSGPVRWRDADLAAIATAHGPAEALLAGHARHGADVLQHMAGAFAVAVIDRVRGELLLAIDRAGVAAMTWGKAGDGAAVFATSADAVAAYPAMAATVRPQAVYEFLFQFNVPAPMTIYREQEKLLPAQMVSGTVGQGNPFPEPRFYWEMPYTKARAGRFDDWADDMRARLRDSFAQTINGIPHDRLGAFLSGGLDSSTVTGLLAEVTDHARSFTIGFDEELYDERPFARLAARHFGAEYHDYIPVPGDVLDLMDPIADVYDEPYGNTSAVPAFLCARMAREAGVSVMLAGDGGDEIFAGNERYAYTQTVERYGLIPRAIRKAVLEPMLALPGMDRLPVLGPVWQKARRLSRRYNIPMPDRLYSFGYMLDADASALFAPDWLAEMDAGAVGATSREVYNRVPQADILQRMMMLDLKNALADNDLRKVNRMCALAGVEVRFPFLDDDLMTFAASIPSSVLMPGNRLRDFFKRSMSGFLPDEIITKTKHGFGLPFEHWIKTDRNLQDRVRDLLDRASGRPIFNAAFVRHVAECAVCPDPSPLDGMAWDLAMFELWLSRRDISL